MPAAVIVVGALIAGSCSITGANTQALPKLELQGMTRRSDAVFGSVDIAAADRQKERAEEQA